MRRRDEPKLDDLKKLLRRLETIEADGGHGGRDSAHDRSSNSEYVGALRGAAVVVEPEGDGVRAGAGAYGRNSDVSENSSSKPRQSSMASIVIGAATAAIVSSLAVVAMLLWTGGQGARVAPDSRVPASAPKLPAPGAPSQAGPALNYVPAIPRPAQADDGSSRMPAVAPAETSPTPSQPDDVASSLDAGALERQAELLIQGGNLEDARHALERAAGLGSGSAALALGATYDPVRMDEFGRLGARADPVVARAWYERARALGANEATARIGELAKK